MAFKYYWRKESAEGRLLDPDDEIERSEGWQSYPRFNCYKGYDTEDEAVEAYNQAIKGLPSYSHDCLVLIKFFSPGLDEITPAGVDNRTSKT